METNNDMTTLTVNYANSVIGEWVSPAVGTTSITTSTDTTNCYIQPPVNTFEITPKPYYSYFSPSKGELKIKLKMDGANPHNATDLLNLLASTPWTVEEFKFSSY